MPLFKYFMIVGVVLTGLLVYADSVMAPVPWHFNEAQKSGLPKAYKSHNYAR